jgi:hypothetical protein
MRVFAAWILALGLAAAPVMAAGGSGDSNSPAAKSNADREAASKAKSSDGAKATEKPGASKASAPAKAEPAEMEGELQQLRDLLEAQSKQLQQQSEQLQEQQKKMESLQQQLNATTSSRGHASSAEATPTEADASSVSSAPAASTAGSQPSAPDVALSSSRSNLAANAKPAVLDSAARAAAQKSEPKLGPIAFQDFKIGATFFADWSYYNSTGFGQQFMDTPTNQLVPGNDGYNTFEINRAYINFQYTPNEHVALRVTPDIYRNSDGSYVLRLKYGYVDFQKIFGDGAFKGTKITFGQTQQPLTDWEEGLYGYRYTGLTPWNYLSLSSTYVGAKIHGPIESNGKEYLDYDLGVFNNNSFHAIELNETKSFMVRATVYPFGTTTDRTGLGFTIFNDFGYKAAIPSATQTSLDRLAAIAFYQTHSKSAQIAFEYDWGHNAYGTGNLFNGAGTPTGGFAALATEATTALSGDTHQRGFDAFGHIRLGNSPFSLWGLYQYFQPNTDYNYRGDGFSSNPIDFERTLGGISYAVTKQFDLAFGDENFHWLHPQGLPGTTDTNGIVIWSQFNF